MNLAWTNPVEAFRFAFGKEQGPLAETIVFLHKDRLNEIERILGQGEKFRGRWQGITTQIEGKTVAYILTACGAADVCDCILHLSVFPPKQLLFTGTCGGLGPKVRIGDLCLVEEGWIGSNISDWLEDPQNVISNARYVDIKKKINTKVLHHILNTQFNSPPKQVKGFSVPFQALEAPQILSEIQKIGADVVDMESMIFLAVSKHCEIPALALLWCTDRPEDYSFYKNPTNEIKEIQQKVWSQWPEIILSVTKSIIGY